MGLSIQGLKAKTSRMRKLIWKQISFCAPIIKMFYLKYNRKIFQNNKIKKTEVSVSFWLRLEVMADVHIYKGDFGWRLYHHIKLQSSISYTVWGKSWTSNNMKSSVSPDRKWQPKNVVLSESFIGISWSVFEKNVTEHRAENHF